MRVNGIHEIDYTSNDERGFALLMTVFVIALATLLVMSFVEETFQYQRVSRNFTERIQATFVLKSSINMAKVLLELPKPKEITEDWLGDIWAGLANGAPPIPLSDVVGECRMMIADESGKIDLNAVVPSGGSFSYGNPYGGSAGSPSGTGSVQPGDERSNFWKNVLRELFAQVGFAREQYGDKSGRTAGNMAFDAANQVAVISDWIDADSVSHRSASFPGEGIESSADPTWFYNRSFRSIAELALVPGMTLERVARIAPYVRVSPTGNSRVNVNTAPVPVLLALGFPESQVEEMQRERLNLPITRELLGKLVAGNPQLGQMTTVNSQEFSVYSQVKTANSTRWARATIVIQGAVAQRYAVIKSIELI